MPDDWALSPAARSDIADIWFDGARRWSVAQADRYQDGLFDLFDLIVTQPRMGPERPRLGEGVHVYPHRQHIVLYLVADDEIEIARVLPARSDWVSGLRL